MRRSTRCTRDRQNRRRPRRRGQNRLLILCQRPRALSTSRPAHSNSRDRTAIPARMTTIPGPGSTSSAVPASRSTPPMIATTTRRTAGAGVCERRAPCRSSLGQNRDRGRPWHAGYAERARCPATIRSLNQLFSPAAALGAAATLGVADFSAGLAARRSPAPSVVVGVQVVGLVTLPFALLLLPLRWDAEAAAV